jgi:GNAT superfamily N-acetyltransferase
MITTRQVTPADATDVSELSYQLGYTVSAEQTMQNIKALLQSESHTVFVAVDKKVIGWIGVTYQVSLEIAPVCFISGLIIDEQYRNKGVGKLLIERAKEWSRNKKVSRLRLRCNVKRAETHKFYEHLGFVELKQQKLFEITV